MKTPEVAPIIDSVFKVFDFVSEQYVDYDLTDNPYAWEITYHDLETHEGAMDNLINLCDDPIVGKSVLPFEDIRPHDVAIGASGLGLMVGPGLKCHTDSTLDDGVLEMGVGTIK